MKYSSKKLANCISFLLLIFSCFSNVNAQELSLECIGRTEMASTIGTDNYVEKNSYEFSNGKLFGYLDAEWSVNSITVIFPKQKNINNIELYERQIIFDRLLGTVFDFTKLWRSDIRKIGSDPNVVFTFKGDCRKSTKKF